MAESPTPAEEERRREGETFARWKAELDYALKDKHYKAWIEKAEKIVKRYRDERKEIENQQRRLNILWSNTQTLKPAIYAQAPKPIVERRFLDRDPAARTASLVLERALSFQLEVSHYHASTDKSVLDYLLPGMGQTWVRYEPQFEPEEAEGEAEEPAEDAERDASEIEEEGEGDGYERLAYEKTCVDYVFYQDFVWGPARCWAEVPWVARRSYLTKAEIKQRFGAEQAERVTLDYTPDRLQGEDVDEQTLGFFKKAQVWEIWNKADNRVYFIPPASSGVVLEERDDPLNLECFWPCPEPLFATQTNDTLVPVPDFVEYQDQAKELDELTDRIAKITTAVRANGVYNAEYPALQRLLQEGIDNKLIAIDNWAGFAEKGGIPGAISMVPLKEVIETLVRLYEARSQVKADLYEVTGISDIVRGYSGGSAKTATEQRIKGQFASLRLEDRRAAVARFCRETIAIQAEIIAETFSDESLMLMSGYEQLVRDRMRRAAEGVPEPQSEDPQAQAAEMQQYEAAQQQAASQAQQEAMQEFQQALQILRSDKLRGFRVDIETDSTLQVDAQADKESAVELVTGTLSGLAQAGEVIQMAPELIEPIGDLLLFAYRRFRVGRSVESKFEEAIDQMVQRVENPGPKPPDPEQIKAQAEIQKQQMENERARMDTEAKEREHAMEMEKMREQWAIEQRRFELEEQKMDREERKLRLQMEAAERKAESANA